MGATASLRLPPPPSPLDPTQGIAKFWGVVNLILLHGAAGIWDEVACLAIPATAILGVALAVLRQKPARDAEGDDAEIEAAIVGEDDDAHDRVPDRPVRSEG